MNQSPSGQEPDPDLIWIQNDQKEVEQYLLKTTKFYEDLKKVDCFDINERGYVLEPLHKFNDFNMKVNFNLNVMMEKILEEFQNESLSSSTSFLLDQLKQTILKVFSNLKKLSIISNQVQKTQQIHHFIVTVSLSTKNWLHQLSKYNLSFKQIPKLKQQALMTQKQLSERQRQLHQLKTYYVSKQYKKKQRINQNIKQIIIKIQKCKNPAQAQQHLQKKNEIENKKLNCADKQTKIHQYFQKEQQKITGIQNALKKIIKIIKMYQQYNEKSRPKSNQRQKEFDKNEKIKKLNKQFQWNDESASDCQSIVSNLKKNLEQSSERITNQITIYRPKKAQPQKNNNRQVRALQRSQSRTNLHTIKQTSVQALNKRPKNAKNVKTENSKGKESANNLKSTINKLLTKKPSRKN